MVKSKSGIYFIFFISKPGNNHINKHIKSIRNIHNAITEKENKIPCEKGLHISVQANTHLMQSMECSYAQLWGTHIEIRLDVLEGQRKGTEIYVTEPEYQNWERRLT